MLDRLNFCLGEIIGLIHALEKKEDIIKIKRSCIITLDKYILYYFTLWFTLKCLLRFQEMAVFLIFSIQYKKFYKIWFKIVKMGFESGQQHLGKSNKIVLILRPDYLFTSQFESMFFLHIKGQDIF